MDNSLLVQMENIDFVVAVQNLIKKECIIDFGIVQRVVAKGLVNVEMAVSSTKQNKAIVTCVLANIASSAFTVDIEPEEGDRVIVFYPKNYDDSMFKADKNKEVIVNKNALHYSLFGGIAFLFNQYKVEDHKNFMQVNADGLNVTLKEGETFSVTNGKATFNVDADGNISIETSGKYTIKNDKADLFTIINGMLQILNTSLATAGSPASHTVVPNQFSTQSTQLSNLMQ